MLVGIIQHIYNKTVFFVGSCRARFWGIFTKKMGRNVIMMRGCMLMTPSGISFGNNININRHSNLSGQGELKIGDNVLIGPNCNILTSNHGFSRKDIPMIAQEADIAPVTIEDDVWLGANVVVTPGVFIGKGSIIGANAVVTKSIPRYSIAAGVPAKVIKKRE